MLQAGTKSGLRWARLLMATSIVVLSVFVGYWLSTQYQQQRVRLEKDLNADLAEAYKEVLDSVLYKRFILPAMQASGLDTTNELASVTVSAPEITTTVDPVSGAIVSPTDGIAAPEHTTMKRIFKKRTETVELDSNQNVGINKAFLSVSVSADSSVQYQYKTDWADTSVLEVVSHLLNTVVKRSLSDSSGNVGLSLQPADFELVRNGFNLRLAERGSVMRANWLADSTVSAPRGQLLVAYQVLENQDRVAVARYQWYLLLQILPQILFATVMLLLVVFAFRISYRNLKRQLKLSEMKSGLISNMSHKLKIPVATVKVALEALDSYDVINKPEQARAYIKMARHETDRLELLITKVLHTSLMEQGKITLQREPTDIVSLANDVVQSIRIRARDTDLTITVDVEGEGFLLDIDPLHVQGAIFNVMDNSLKYATPPIRIHAKIIGRPSDVELQITDNGPGIPEQYLSQVFETFFRVPTGDRHNVKGYGLGLSYVQQVMRLHGGAVSVENGAGGGCRFIFKFQKAS